MNLIHATNWFPILIKQNFVLLSAKLLINENTLKEGSSHIE